MGESKGANPFLLIIPLPRSTSGLPRFLLFLLLNLELQVSRMISNHYLYFELSESKKHILFVSLTFRDLRSV